jgi:riboflavin biosynthesis pyrimidine reductase
MLADGLVDELHLFVYPLVRGPGKRLFAYRRPGHQARPRRIGTYSNGAVHLTYRPAA